MRRRTFVLVLAVLAAGLLVTSLAGAGSAGKKNIKANLTGFQEVPAVSSFGSGSFTAVIDDDAQTITYELSFGGLNSSSLFAHIHPSRKRTTDSNSTGPITAVLLTIARLLPL